MSNIQNLLTTPGDYTFTPNSSGQATIILKAGGGGGGGACYNPNSSSTGGAPAGGGGGGGGGSLMTTVQLQQGVRYLLTVGKGGAVNSNNPQSDPGENTSLTGGQINLEVYGGTGGFRGYFGTGGTGGNGGAPDGGGGGGGGGGNNGFAPVPDPTTLGGPGGAGAAQGASGGRGGDCQNYTGAAGGGGGAGGYNTPGNAAGDGNPWSPGQGGKPPQDFSQLLTPGPGLNGEGVFSNSAFSGIGFGGGGGGASAISASDVSGRGGLGAGVPSWIAGPLPGNAGLACLYFSETINFVPRPTIHTFSPPSGGEGTLLTIVGANFSPTAANNKVLFDGHPVPVASATQTTLTVVVPFNFLDPVTMPLYVETNNVVSNPSRNEFTFLPTPVINSLDYNPIGIGAQLDIQGSNFTSPPATNTVYFTGGISVVPTQGDSNSLVVTVPVGAKNGPMYVKNGGGQSNSVQLTIQVVPEIIGFGTITGLGTLEASPGEIITVYGAGFSTTLLQNTVVFPGGSGEPVLSAKRTEMTVRVPEYTYSGFVLVSVNRVKSAAFRLFILRKPALDSFSPPAARVGQPVTIKGNYYSQLDHMLVILANGRVVPAQYIDIQTVQFIVPGGAVSGTFTLQFNGNIESAPSTQPLTIIK